MNILVVKKVVSIAQDFFAKDGFAKKRDINLMIPYFLKKVIKFVCAD